MRGERNVSGKISVGVRRKRNSIGISVRAESSSAAGKDNI